jgi:menaquinone-dependent protoporphyrinogen IX oxidase
MSNLKYLSDGSLLVEKQKANEYIDKLLEEINKKKSAIAGAYERLKWIDIYIEKRKGIVPMTIQEIESALGHKVVIRGSSS